MAPVNNNTEDIFNLNKNLSIPKWINEDYFIPILEKNVEHFKCISKFTTVAATAPGENYTSIMVRVVVDVLLKDGFAKRVSYILKTPLESDNVGAAFVTSMNLFPKELQMYGNYLPKFEQLYRDAGVHVQISPKCIHSEDSPERTVLVLEDLSRENFKNMDRLKGFDFTYMRLVLNKLAELHAASAVYREMNGAYEEIFHGSFLNEANRKMFETDHESRNLEVKNAMKEWGLDDAAKYNKRFVDFETHFQETLRINRADPNEFNVLNHGDMWTNNIMFKHSADGEVERTVFVDFQICKWGSPVQDLWYLFTTSTLVDIRVAEFDHFIQIYHSRLVECLRLLKYSKAIPTLKEMHMLIVKYGYWGSFAANIVTATLLFPGDEEACMDKMIARGPEAEKYRHRMLTAPIYVRSMRQWYPFLFNKGAFDFDG